MTCAYNHKLTGVSTEHGKLDTDVKRKVQDEIHRGGIQWRPCHSSDEAAVMEVEQRAGTICLGRTDNRKNGRIYLA